MLTRRTLRIKAMQHLYAFYMQKRSLATWDGVAASHRLLTAFEQDIMQMQKLHWHLLQLLLFWAALDEENEKERLYPSARHLNNNHFIVQLRKDATWQQLGQRYQMEWPEEQVQLWFYTNMAETPLLNAYKERAEVRVAIEHKLIEDIFRKIILQHAAIQTYIIEAFLDDEPYKAFFEGALYTFIRKFMQQDPQSFNFYHRDTFAEQVLFYTQMLEKVLAKEELYETWIEQHAQHWSIARMPLLDQVLLKMGLTEQLFFKDIPQSVTLNEYVELAKLYSTPDSYRFINGMLEAMLRKPLS